MQLSNRDGELILASALVSLDFSYLVRLGLRGADDPRIQDTIKVVDHVLRVETPSGPVYHRYNEDGYGEHADGSPFDGCGIGRGWPLLVGERGHLAMQAGEDSWPTCRPCGTAPARGGCCPSRSGTPTPLRRGLQPGRPSGSAMPLLWSHAEFLKLVIAQESRRPVEMLQSVERYFGPVAVGAPVRHWRGEVPVWHLQAGKALCIEDRRPFLLHFGYDGWQHIQDRIATEQPFGMWSALLSSEELGPHRRLEFTRRYDTGWEGADHHVSLGHPLVTQALFESAPGGQINPATPVSW